MIRSREFVRFVVILLFFTATQSAFCEKMWLTEKQFQDNGAEEVVGQVTRVQILASNQYYEVGTVEVRITRVVAGAINVQSLTLTFQRSFGRSDEPANWDLLGSPGKSLSQTLIGKTLILFLAQSGNEYSLYTANNAVQDATDGLLTGRIVAVHKSHGDPYWERGLEIEIQVTGTVYGWVKGTTITLPLAKPLLLADLRFHGGLLNSLWLPVFPGALSEFHEGECVPVREKEFFISFANEEVQSIQVASKQELDALKLADSQ